MTGWHRACPYTCWGLLMTMFLLGCSDDPSVETYRVTFEAQSCATAMEVEGQDNDSRLYSPTTPFFTTRTDDPPTWTPPSPYVTFEQTFGADGLFQQQKNLVNKSINAFFTQNEESPLEGTFFYKDADGSWRLNMDIENSGTYYLYGYIPKEDASSANVSPYDAYSNGAVLTINGLNSVTPSDVCVIVGAKNGLSATNDNGLTTGQFAVDAKSVVKNPDGTTAAAGSNFIFLLFDHLYSSLRFRFTVNSDYAALRTIKLRKLELTSYDDQGGGVKAKYNATITLQKKENGASPIMNVNFSPDDTSSDVSQVPIFDGEVELPVYDSQHLPQFMGSFVPGDYTKFKLRSTYDVYDKNVTPEHPEGNLIRQGCQAENTIDLTDNKFGGEDLKVMRGHCYSFKIKVQPTYLYVLSEPDLDNPTMSFGN